jgi:hypothetical protein
LCLFFVEAVSTSSCPSFFFASLAPEGIIFVEASIKLVPLISTYPDRLDVMKVKLKEVVSPATPSQQLLFLELFLLGPRFLVFKELVILNRKLYLAAPVQGLDNGLFAFTLQFDSLSTVKVHGGPA